MREFKILTIDLLKRPYHYNVDVSLFWFVSEVIETSKDVVTWTWIMRSLTTLESSVVGALSGIIEVFLQQPSVSIKTAIQVCMFSLSWHARLTYNISRFCRWYNESTSPRAHTMQSKHSYDFLEEPSMNVRDSSRATSLWPFNDVCSLDRQ